MGVTPQPINRKENHRIKRSTTAKLGKVIEIDEGRIRDHLGEMVRGTVEETLNGLLEAEADRLCKASRYQRSLERTDTRAGHYSRKLQTKAGEVTLNMPKLRQQTFETAIIDSATAGVRPRWRKRSSRYIWPASRSGE